LGISLQHLSTTVKQVTGRNVLDVIAYVVIIDAKAKLKSSNMTIQEIAYSLNFPSASFFGKYFRRYVGMSPLEFRNS
jgi:AraC-like DNA-binding protein